VTWEKATTGTWTAVVDGARIYLFSTKMSKEPKKGHLFLNSVMQCECLANNVTLAKAKSTAKAVEKKRFSWD